MNKTVCILGGSFDPVTYGHEMILSKISNLNWIDEVWIVLCRFRSDKCLGEFKHRTNMFSLIVDNNIYDINKKKIHFKDIEYRDRSTPTYDLLTMLKNQYPDFTFYFVIGSDLLNDILSWDHGEKLVSENNFIIFERSNFNINGDILKQFNNYDLIKIKNTSFVNYISSTAVRKLIAQNEGIDVLSKYIHPVVYDYIKEHKLYKPISELNHSQSQQSESWIPKMEQVKIENSEVEQATVEQATVEHTKMEIS
ncbi:nicotinate-nucleotide adenylyltransferase [Hepatocystis sp. ex Piliocolobus tephrosceles]|nr:nicotinate-nucleotide adenylyltransferase [Hepatocystis sp. ex Piliocolobus tephrosceles]